MGCFEPVSRDASGPSRVTIPNRNGRATQLIPHGLSGGYFMRQSPDHAYDIAFFDEFARARRGGPSASLSRTPNSARRVDHRPQ
jgi:hypothetical protein